MLENNGAGQTVPGSTISPKVTAAALGSAVSTVFWIVLGSTLWSDTFSDVALTALTGATATVITFVVGYLIRDPRRDSRQTK